MITELYPIHINATTLPDAWFQCLYNIIANGRVFKIDKGSYAGQNRLEFDYITIHIKRPWERCVDGLPLIPEMPDGCSVPAPATKDYIKEYIPYLMTDKKKDNEQYTYGERLCNATWKMDAQNGFPGYREYINQILTVINIYKRNGHRNNQMVLQVAQPSDLRLKDPPCLRHIDTRIQDGKLHFFPYFRSWDLWGGMPANLAGISMLQEYMASEIGVEQGEMICSSKGLHLYDYAINLAEVRCMIEKQRDVTTMEYGL